jgi:serine acetyltransferase
LGTGAKLLGGVNIADNTIVGANVVIKKDLIAGSAYFDEMIREHRIRVVDSGYIERMASLAG